MRLLIVSNRLPFTLIKTEGGFSFQDSVGGLATGLRAYLDSSKNTDYLWIGWPGSTVDDEIKEKVQTRALREFRAYPIFLSENTIEKFYNGCCNKTIYPLFHYFPSYVVCDEDYWVNYKRANEIFRDAILEVIKPNDVVWVHDSQLMLLPKLLREKMPDVPIGFFLHIPFPSFEMFRLLPRKWCIEILDGLLGADLIGFHTYDYTQYFLRCVLRILGYDHNMGQIVTGNRLVKVDTFPMGIDFQKFHNAADSPEVLAEKNKLRTVADFKTIFSIDRLDYTKGIINRLQGYEVFLEQNLQWHKRVILILAVVPSRTEVEHYQQMKKEIDELVGRINGKFGSIDWTPILYQYKFLPFHSLVALYSASDVALITPFRDGMNLISKEYIATRVNKTGVLILSEMAGASKELGEAIIINPNSKEEIADALKRALEMPLQEQVRRNEVMQSRLRCYDVFRWADDFIRELLSVKEEQKIFNAKLLGSHVKELVNNYKEANQRLILLDYDGTLVPFARHPELAKPDEGLLKILKQLSEDHKTNVVLLSGRTKDILQEWFGVLNMELVAEHGACIKEKNGDWSLTRSLTTGWKSRILPILKIHADRLPGSFIEEKEFSVAWHYRGADPEPALTRAKELMDDLVNFTANVDVQVLHGNKVVEITNAGVNKGTAATHFLARNNSDFVLAIGDDSTDEDLFKALPETAYSIRVGMAASLARFNLHDSHEVIELLKQLTRE